MNERKLHEFWITLNFEVEALDEEQAIEIARDLLARAQQSNPWNIHWGEVMEVGDQ